MLLDRRKREAILFRGSCIFSMDFRAALDVPLAPKTSCAPVPRAPHNGHYFQGISPVYSFFFP
jgi:hypothetical protein